MNFDNNPIKIENLRILSLDGGGIRGVAVARILQEIEKHFKKPIHELFDLVIGTSTGGLLSLMLTVPNKFGRVMTATDAKNLYINNAQAIFSPNQAHWVTQMGVKYSHEGLTNIITEVFGHHPTLKHAKTHVGVCTTDEMHNKSIVLNSFRAMKYPHDYRHGAKLTELAMATTAAPTYFDHITLAEMGPHAHPEMNKQEEDEHEDLNTSVEWFEMDEPKYTRKNILLEDGGTTNNNPSYLGMKLIKHVLNHHNMKAKNIQVVSIGTGNITGKEEDPGSLDEKFWNNVGSGVYGVVQRALLHDPFNIAAKSFEVHKKIINHFREKNQHDNYVRAQFKITDYQLNNMDDVSKKNIDSLVQAAENYLFTDDTQQEYSACFKRVLKLISSHKKGDPLFNIPKDTVIEDEDEFNDFEEINDSFGDDGSVLNCRIEAHEANQRRRLFSSENLVAAAKYIAPIALSIVLGMKTK